MGLIQLIIIAAIIVVIIVVIKAVKNSKGIGDTAVPADQTNKVVNVTLTGGIIGLLAASPQNSLNSIIKKENANGWRVIQVIPAASGNIFLFIFRLLILVLTLFLYTPVDGYYVIMERATVSKQSDTVTPSEYEPKCSKCGNSIKAGDAFCENCGNKLK